jgi:glycosyltransferase involved in cell wall biosynthesis
MFAGFVKQEHKDPLHIIYTGRVVRSKGLFDLVGILKHLNAERFILDVIGYGEDMEELKAYVTQKGIGSKVVFHGKVEHEKVISKLFDSDIFVIPSKRVEGFPMTIPEAMFSSLPVVGTDIGGISDAVEDGKTGFLVKQSAFGLFQEKLLLLIRDKNLREIMGNNARIKAEKEFTLDIMLNHYENAFMEVLL